uniref:NADH-ubiquinone oxidoreductase chain 6 n=3 Tax=Samia TaxID=7126 RepID=G9FXD3_SAMRI|nr:NADH dehydrogenase subunit 6 [Samia ricini]YP_009040582.1 NADH dehydrogenase subunit 6 [Samia canningi]AEI26138.1 NADH dehydrogenase subunit 6 [Samia ricini]AEK82942.1 NADH dehydrogenase subunit 6 [Samia ricini]AHX80603.1 NADH dehydrogenase subunit 6 [Samia canningi]UIB41634.1 NADH dehydrogenase subunit 6 [Samia ricini]
MTKIILSSLIIFFSFIMYFLNHPLSMGLMILIQTLLTCLLSGMMIKTYWFSYILFLTFLGGLLVLFIYVSSIASNELFSFNLNMKMFIFFMMFFSTLMMILFWNNLNWMNFNINNSEMINFSNSIMFLNENKINLNKLYNNQNFLITYLLIIYLFITLVAMVKITNIFYGPLRTNF